MVDSSQDLLHKARTLLRATIRLMPFRLDRLLTGMTHALERNRVWLRLYVSLAVLANFLHFLLVRQRLRPGFWTEIAPAIVALSCAFFLLDSARLMHQHNRQRPFPRLLMVMAAFGSLVAVTVPLLPLGDLVKASLGAAALAWCAATLLMMLILFFPATAFNPDFAHLGMFRRYTLLLEVASGFLLFFSGAQQLLLWPKFILGPDPLSADAFFEHIASPIVPQQMFSDVLFVVLATSLTVAILLLAVFGLYLQLAHRWWHRSPFETLRGTFRLMFDNLLYRLAGEGNQIWPTMPERGKHGQSEDTGTELRLEEFLFSSGLAAVSLIFGLWVPRAVPQGLSSLNPHRFLETVWQAGWTKAIAQSGLLAFVILVLFLAGGIDLWLRTIESAGSRGSYYTLGLWLGTLSLYWATTLIAVLGINDIAVFSALLLPKFVVNAQNTFAILYRGSLGALTVLIAIGQSRQLSQNSRLPKTLRYGLATIALLVLLSFAVGVLGQVAPIAKFVPAIALAIIFMAAVALFRMPQRSQRISDVQPLGAQLIASSSLALAPLLASERLDSIRWSEQGYADMTVKNVGFSPEPLQLRAFIVGSEDEVAFEAISRAHAKLRGPFDFVLTDLRTAIKIMGAYRHSKHRDSTQYKIMSVVAAIPWQYMDVGEGEVDQMVLDVGYLRFTPTFNPPQDRDHACDLVPYRCRPTSLANAAYYAANHQGDVDGVITAEPFYSWLMRQPSVRRRPSKWPRRKRLVPYVLLARHQEPPGRPAVSFNWRRTICEMVKEGQLATQESQGVVNHAHLHKLHGFLQAAIGSRVELHLEDIHLGICRSRFEAMFPVDGDVEHRLAILELYVNGFIRDKQRQEFGDALNKNASGSEAIIKQALEATKPQVIYHDPDDTEEQFFRRFYRAPDTEPEGDAGRKDIDPFLHTLVMVPLPDRPGQLADLLSELEKERPTGKMDLAMVATANLGDSALVYLLNRKDLIGLDTVSPELVGKPFVRKSSSTAWVQSLREQGFDPTEIKAFMVPLQHQAGGLLSVVKTLVGAEDGGVNLEQVFAFPLSETIAVAFLISKQEDRPELYRRLTGQGGRGGQAQSPIPLVQCSKFVTLDKCLPRERHKQQAVFNIALKPSVLKPGTQVVFECRGLPTWTPNWGNVNSWIAEVGFDEIRLKIPTTLAWEITLTSWIGRLPLFGKLARQLLRGKVPGIAGLNDYKDPSRWCIEIRDKGEATVPI